MEVSQGWSGSQWMVGSLQGLGDATSGSSWGCAWSGAVTVSMVSSAVGLGRRTVLGHCAGEQQQQIAPCHRSPAVWSAQPKQVCKAER